MDHILKSFHAHREVFSELQTVVLQQLEQLIPVLHASLSSGSTIFWCGNGGSASDSQHLASELVGRYTYDRPPYRSIALTTDTSLLTAISNDYDFQNVFARQLQGIAKPNDVLISLSTSGSSKNVILATSVANSLGLITVGLTGHDGGDLAPLCDYALIVPSCSTARIQEAHIFLGHCICEGIQTLDQLFHSRTL